MKASTTLISVSALFLFACGGEASLGGLDGGNPASGAGGAGTTSSSSSTTGMTTTTTQGAGGATSGTTTGGSGGSSAGKGGSAGGGTGGKIPIDAGDPCMATKCPAGTFCVAEPVACIPEANCPPYAAKCEVACGGFGGFPCPGLGTCADNPYDNCDPMRGGADCGGLCQCTAMAKCSAGQVWNSSPTVCSCVGGSDAGSDAGPLCGKTWCPVGQVCCNPVMGVCAPPGNACIQ